MIKVRNPKETEFEAVYRFVSKCKPLENYKLHFYKIMLRYFKNTCFVAMHEGKIAGFVLGFISQTQKETFFMWQFGISPGMQGKGVGQTFLKGVSKTGASSGSN